MIMEQLASLTHEHVNLHAHRVGKQAVSANIHWSDFKRHAIEHLDHIDWVAKEMKVNDSFYTGIFDATLDCIIWESIDHNVVERILAGCHQLIHYLQEVYELGVGK